MRRTTFLSLLDFQKRIPKERLNQLSTPDHHHSRHTDGCLFQPRPFRVNASLGQVSHLLENSLRHIQIGLRTANTPIHDLDIHALPVPTQPQLHPAQRIIIRVCPLRSSVKEDVRNGANQVGAGVGIATGPQSRVVVSQVSLIRAAVGSWQSKIRMSARVSAQIWISVG